MKTINIGLVGAGTVGSGVIEILKKNRSLIAERTGIDLNLSMICDTNPALAKKYPEIKIVSEYKEITNNASINILIETVGGTGIAFDILKAAISSKKTVVTANKALISEKGNEIFQLAEANNVEIGYEAAVGGTIPVIRTLKTGFVSNNYESIYGILNGTTNFILSKMEEENLDYDKALKEAQDLGFAEKDPTFDVEGIDAAHKLSILGGLAFNIKIPVSKIYIEGISKITSTEIQFAKLLGYRIKLLGICRLNGGLVEARVHPVMVPLSHPIANIMNEMNAIYMHTNFSGPAMLMGKGAGSLPTASAIISDLDFYSARIGKEKEFMEKNFYPEGKLADPGDTNMKYYLRFNTVDKPGVLSEIARVLGENKISISSVRQNETSSEPVEVVVVTHHAREKDMLSAITAIDKMNSIIKEKTVMIRLEDRL